MSSAPWKGVFPALVTPLTDAGALDRPALRRVIDWTMSHGVHGLSVVGSTGEGALLPFELQRDVVRVAVKARTGRPLLVAILASGPQDTLRFARFALDAGADGVLATPPYYYPLDQQAVFEFYSGLADKLDGPILIYHIPAFTKIPLEVPTLTALAALPRVAGIKDSSHDADFHRRVIESTRHENFSVFAGSGRLLPVNVAAGGHGAIAASANLIPDALTALWRALGRGDTAAANDLHTLVDAVEATCRSYAFPATWKASVELAGLAGGQPAFPLSRLSPDQMDSLRRAFARLGVIPVPNGKSDVRSTNDPVQ